MSEALLGLDFNKDKRSLENLDLDNMTKDELIKIL